MPVEDERRSVLRVPLPVQLWFNVLQTEKDYMRGDITTVAALPFNDFIPEIEGREDLERFLVRIDNKLDLILSILADKIGRKDYQFKGAVIDVSENGLKMASSEELDVERHLEMGMVLPIPPYRTMDMAGKIIWKTESDETENGGTLKLYGIQFTNILPHDQDEIVHWVFQKQREAIRMNKEKEDI